MRISHAVIDGASPVGRDRIGTCRSWSGRLVRAYRERVVFYGVLGVLGLGIVVALLRSPGVLALCRGEGTDPSQFGSWQDHLDDIGLGVSWRNDGSGGRRESRSSSPATCAAAALKSPSRRKETSKSRRVVT